MVVSAAVSPSSPVSRTATAIVRRRRPDPWKTSFFVVAVVALVGGVAWALLGSSFFVVRSGRVGGTGPIPRQKVLAASGVTVGPPPGRGGPAPAARRAGKIAPTP